MERCSVRVKMIPEEYNGKYAGFQGGNYGTGYLIIGGNIGTSGLYQPIQIVNGRVSLPTWVMYEGDTLATASRYSGNHTCAGSVGIFPSATEGKAELRMNFTGCNFSNGSASKNWSEGTEGNL